MDPDVRTALLALGMLFVVAFGGMSLYVIADSGFDTYGDLLLAAFSLFVVVGSFFAAVGLVAPFLGAPLCLLVLLTFLATCLNLPPFLYREELRCSLFVFLP